MSRRIPALIATLSLLVLALGVSSQTSTGRAMPEFLHLEVGEQVNRVEMLHPRGSKGEDQPSKFRPFATTVSSAVPQNGIQYHGGPVIQAISVVAIYWASTPIFTGGPTPGTTGPGSADGSLVGYFMANLGGTPYYNINTTYTDANGTPISNSVTYTRFWANTTNAPSGTQSVSDTAIQNMILSGFNSGQITYDPNTVYTVFSSGAVNLGGGFGGANFQYCAYHGSFASTRGTVVYAVMPYNYAYPNSCSAFNGGGAANGDPGADAEVNTLAHEIEEAQTDPRLNAWYDSNGLENADKCAWMFGTVALNGGKANIAVGTRNYLVQQQWLNLNGGSCAQTYGAAPTTGALTGKVSVSGSGTAIAGATVAINGGASTTTDINGNYAFANVAAGSYGMTVTKSGYANGAASGVVVATGATTTQNFALTANLPSAGVVTGKVISRATGTAIMGATVTLTGGAATTTDAGGNYTFASVPGGAYGISASASGYAALSTGVSVTNGYTTTLNFQLAPAAPTAGTLSGKVTVSGAGTAVAGATVAINGVASTTSDLNGNYTISGVAAGTYGMTVTKAGYVTGSASSVAVTAGLTTTQNFALTVVAPTSGTLTGKVTVSGSGTAIAGATVAINGGASTTTDASGNYTFANVSPGTYAMTVTASGYVNGSASGVAVTAGATTTQNFALTATPPTTGTLTGKVTVSGSGTAIAGATVAINGGASATTDASGNYTLSTVTPGTYGMTATTSGYVSGSASGVAVTAGATTTQNFALTATAPTTGTLTGKVTVSGAGTAIAGATVAINGGASTTSDANGNYTFSTVTPGTYGMTVTKAGYVNGSASSVAVTAGTTTTQNFALTAAPTSGTLTGKVTASGAGTAIVGATVAINGGASTTTDGSGNYTFSNVTAGTYGMTVSASGYVSGSASGVAVTAGLTTTQNFALTAAPTLSVPGAPTASAATNPRSCFLGIFCSGGGVRVTWTTPAANGSPITGYRIFRGTTPTVITSGTPFATASSTSTGYTDTTRGTTYYYVVVAVNGVGPGPSSNVVSAPPG